MDKKRIGNMENARSRCYRRARYNCMLLERQDDKFISWLATHLVRLQCFQHEQRELVHGRTRINTARILTIAHAKILPIYMGDSAH